MNRATGTTNGSVREMVLSGAEVARLRSLPNAPTFEAIGKRFGVSRQAAHKAYTKYVKAQQAAA